MPWNPKNDQLLKKQGKSLHEYCAVATGTSVSCKFILEAKVYDNVFRKISYLGVFCNWIAWNINLKRKSDFSNSNNFRKYRIKSAGPSYKWKIVSSDNLWQKDGDKLKKSSKIGFSI